MIISIKTINELSDFKINQQLVIKDALAIINENTTIDISLESEYIHSQRLDRNISVYNTFEEANIQSGDILEVIE